MSTEMTKRQENELEEVSERPSVRPPVDIFENRDEYLVVADVPAVAKDDLGIHLEDGRLTIEGRVGEDLGENALEREFRLFNYRRTFDLPETVDRNKVTAELKQGVLRLHLPKIDAVKPRQIRVTAG